MFGKAVLVLVPLVWQPCATHLVTKGPCPPMDVKQNFDTRKYMGTWYGQESFGTESTQGKGRCVTARYSYNEDTGVVDLYNWQVPSPGYRSSINGTSVPLDPSKKEGRMKVTFQVSENRTKTFPLLVLDTDYENWAVVYYCKDLLHHHEKNRTKTFPLLVLDTDYENWAVVYYCKDLLHHHEKNRTKTFPLLVLDTDYENWAVVYYCKDLLHHHETSGWVLTRVQDLDNSVDKASVQEQVQQVLDRSNLSRSLYTKTVQTDCNVS